MLFHHYAYKTLCTRKGTVNCLEEDRYSSKPGKETDSLEHFSKFY